MNRKLLLLDIVLLAVVVYAGLQFRDMYSSAKAREAAQQGVKVKPLPAPPTPQTAPDPPVMATHYAPIAQKFLWDKSRNPEVPVDPTPPPPPPPPMPKLPVYHGMMDFGDTEGPIAIMSTDMGKPHKAIHPGETIGDFKLLAVNHDGIDLEWNGQKVHRKLEELLDRSHKAVAQADPPAIPGGYATPPPPRPPDKPPAQYGPGDQAGDVKRCVENDTTPAGTVVDGFRKIVKPGMFAKTCYWEPVGAH